MKRNILAKPALLALPCLLAACTLFGCSGQGGAASTAPSKGTGSTTTEAYDNVVTLAETTATNASGEKSTSSKDKNATEAKKTSATTKAGNKKPEPTKKKGLYEGLKDTTVQVPIFGDLDELTKKQVDAFKAKYGATVKFTQYGWQEYQSKIIQMVGSKTPPDLTPVFDQQFLTYVGRNVIQSPADYVNLDDPVWNKELCRLYEWGGKLWGVSTDKDLGVFGIYYNKDLFEENGVDDPYTLYKQGKWTFDTFRQAAKDLTVFKDGNRTITGFACWKWDILSMANGGTGIALTDNNGIQITLDKPNELTAFQLIQNMQLTDKSYDYAMSSKDNYFQAGRIAMIAERPAYSALYYKGKFDIGWVPLPKGPDVKGEIAPCIVRSWAVPVGAKNPEGGMAYVYHSTVYNREHANDALVQKDQNDQWPDKTLLAQYNDYMSRAKLHTSFIGGCNNWDKTTRWGFWKEILVDNTPPSTAVAKHKNELQYEINQVLKNFK